MPLMHRRGGEILIRVVYDGEPEAGKTTNIQCLSGQIPLRRRGPLVSPESTSRRTELFDFMDFLGGHVDGSRLRAQLVSVPGQSALLRRRKYLLESADVVVFVADAREAYVDDARRSLELLRTTLARLDSKHPVGILLQANKQDLPDAIPPIVLRERLGLPADTEVIGASAAQGTNVLQTLVRAVALASARVEALASAGELSSTCRQLVTPEQLREHLLRLGLRDESDVRLPGSLDIPESHVWPQDLGRMVLRDVDLSEDCPRPSELRWVPRDVLQVDRPGWWLHTKHDWCFGPANAGKEALESAVRAQRRLGELSLPERGFALLPDGSELRLWAFTPKVATLREELDNADLVVALSHVAVALRAVAEEPSATLDTICWHQGAPRLLTLQRAPVREGSGLRDSFQSWIRARSLHRTRIGEALQSPELPRTIRRTLRRLL